MDSSFSVKVRDFEGPLDLLLDLIEERKLLISDVSLSQVADDFLAFIQRQVAFPLGTAAEFILVSATLLLLKSRSLLPVLSLSNEEEEDVRDLEFRLRLYQAFRGIARSLGAIRERMFFGEGAGSTDPIFAPSRDLSGNSIGEAVRRVLETAPKAAQVKEVAVKTVISLEEMIERLTERIERAISMTFREFSGGHAADKREVVVGFLAMLELFKRGLVQVEQERSFGEISMAYQGEAKAPRF